MTELTPQQKTKSLKIFSWDGAFASGMTGLTQDYFVPFILILGGSMRHIAFLSGLPYLFGALFHLLNVSLVGKKRFQKKFIGFFVFVQGIMLLCMAFMSLGVILSPRLFIGSVVLFSCFGAMSMPAWGALLANLVEANKKDEYLAKRNMISGFIVVVVSFTAGLFLHCLKPMNIFWGFAVLFGFAFIGRMATYHFLTLMEEPVFESPDDSTLSWNDFMARFKESNFTKHVLFIVLMSFSIHLATPFIPVFILRGLHYGYLPYAIITVAGTLAALWAVDRWGRVAGLVGNLRIIQITSILIVFLPILWIFNRHPISLMGIQLLSGFVWAGYHLCATNFIYDSVVPSKRTHHRAYFNMLNGIAICCGAILGGFLMQVLPPLLGHKVLSVFFLSSLLRFMVVIFFFWQLKEVRAVFVVSWWNILGQVVSGKESGHENVV